MKKMERFGKGAALLAAAMLAIGAARAGADGRADAQKLLKEKSPLIVTVKFQLKMSMGGEEQSSETELAGVMIDPKGIVLCSNTQMGGYAGMMSRMMPEEMRGNLSIRPTDIKVIVGEDEEGVEAKLLARDSELDLAWIQIKEPGDKKYTALDLSKSAPAELGDKLSWVWRLGKHFDRAELVGEAQVVGATKKPRELLIPSGVTHYGVPVFNASGELVGVTALQMPGASDMGGNPMEMMGMMMGNAEMMAAMILPASTVAKATARALEGGGKPEEEAKDAAKPAEKTIEKEK